MYYIRNVLTTAGRNQAIPTCYLNETSLLHPDVKHSWLCDGKLLRLLDPQHPANFKLFNERWTIGRYLGGGLQQVVAGYVEVCKVK